MKKNKNQNSNSKWQNRQDHHGDIIRSTLFFHCHQDIQRISIFSVVSLFFLTEGEQRRVFRENTISIMNAITEHSDILYPTGLCSAHVTASHGGPSRWCLPITYFPSSELSHHSVGVGVDSRSSSSTTKVQPLPAISWRHSGRKQGRDRGSGSDIVWSD